MEGDWEPPDWPPLTLPEVDSLLRRYPQAGGAERIVSVSPRPFSSAGVVAARAGGELSRVFVKRHPRSVRDRAALLEEHRFILHLAAQMPAPSPLVQPPLANADGHTVTSCGEWTYEVHPVARGVDLYAQALSWTPFLDPGHARAAGRALAQLHRAAEGYAAPARAPRQLLAGFTLFAGSDPAARMEAYLEPRPLLRGYAEARNWRGSFEELLLPCFARLEPWLPHLGPLWTHNDFHASNMTWSGRGEDAQVVAVFDFGLADRTNAVHDLALAIERNTVEWLRLREPGNGVEDMGVALVHLDHVDALLAGYEQLRPLTAHEAAALPAMLPLAHCEFALSETDYFLTILGSERKARLAYEGYFLRHAQWFGSGAGRRLLGHLEDRAAAAAGSGR